MQGVKLISSFTEELRKLFLGSSDKEFPIRLQHSYKDDNGDMPNIENNIEEHISIHNKSVNRRIQEESSRYVQSSLFNKKN